MSAFMCSDKHINALVAFASRHGASYFYDERRIAIQGNEQRAALVLQAQNARSVNYRYAHNPDAQCDDEPIVYQSGAPLKPLTIIKQCHCFAYQACETDDWERSEAHAIVQAIEGYAARALPGYDAEPWGID